MSFQYDVALSFAGEDRDYVEVVAKQLDSNGVVVFYDRFEEVSLWGKNLYEYLYEVYCNKSEYIVMFISSHYANKLWTNHERQAAQDRAFKEKGKEYILPARFDNTSIPGLPSVIGYLNLDGVSPEEFAVKIIEKIQEGLAFSAKKTIQLLRSTDIEVISTTKESLRTVSNKYIVQELVKAVNDIDINFATNAIESLVIVDASNAVEPLINCLTSKESTVRSVSAKALGRIGDKSAIPFLLGALKDDHGPVRQAAVRALGEFNDLSLIPQLILAIGDSESTVSEEAIRALKEYEDDSALLELSKFLNSPSKQIRTELVTIIAEFEQDLAFTILTQLLNDEDPDIQVQAIRGIRYINDLAALPYLYEAACSKNNDVAMEALEGIEEIMNDYSVDQIKKATRHVGKEVVQIVTRALSEWGQSSTLALYIKNVGQ